MVEKIMTRSLMILLHMHDIQSDKQEVGTGNSEFGMKRVVVYLVSLYWHSSRLAEDNQGNISA
jgi:hypothetical protein